MGESFANAAATGPLALGIAVSVIAGLVSFLSPCVLPLVPGYVSYVTGLAGQTLPVARGSDLITNPSDTSRSVTGRRVAVGTLGFVAGFSAVFVILIVTLSAAGRFLLVNAHLIEVVAGAVIIILGLGFLGLIPALQRQARTSWLPRIGVAGAPLLGATFALSWTPCVSPTLGAVLGLAITEGGSGRAVVLAISYCAGLGLPFLAVGLGLRRFLALTDVVRRHHQWVTRIGAILLIAVGLALITGGWNDFIIWLRVTVGPGKIGL